MSLFISFFVTITTPRSSDIHNTFLNVLADTHQTRGLSKKWSEPRILVILKLVQITKIIQFVYISYQDTFFSFSLNINYIHVIKYSVTRIK